jgi:ABC-type phosphate transport system substrate-binding protein
MRWRMAVGLALLAAVVPAGAPGAITVPGYVVIVHAENPVTAIERDQLSKIFLKRVAKWPDGKPVEPVDLAAGAPLRVTFTTEVHRKSVAAVRAFWQQQIFSGRDVPPPEKSTENDVTTFVKDHAGAVGYVSTATTLPPGVKSVVVQGAGP